MCCGESARTGEFQRAPDPESCEIPELVRGSACDFGSPPDCSCPPVGFPGAAAQPHRDGARYEDRSVPSVSSDRTAASRARAAPALRWEGRLRKNAHYLPECAKAPARLREPRPRIAHTARDRMDNLYN